MLQLQIEMCLTKKEAENQNKIINDKLKKFKE